MSIESLSSIKTSDITRSSKDRGRDVKLDNSQNEPTSQAQVSIIKAGGADAFEKADSFNRQTNTQTAGSLNEKSAIAAYQSMLKEQKRQDIQLLLGVDTFV